MMTPEELKASIKARVAVAEDLVDRADPAIVGKERRHQVVRKYSTLLEVERIIDRENDPVIEKLIEIITT